MHTLTYTFLILVLVKMSLFFRKWEKSISLERCYICLSLTNFLVFFSFSAPQEKRKKNWTFKTKALHCHCGVWCIHGVPWHQYHRQFFCLFFSFFLVSFVPFNFEVDRVSRFCLHLYWAQHFDCLSCHLFFLICSRARIRSTVAKLPFCVCVAPQ